MTEEPGLGIEKCPLIEPRQGRRPLRKLSSNPAETQDKFAAVAEQPSHRKPPEYVSDIDHANMHFRHWRSAPIPVPRFRDPNLSSFESMRHVLPVIDVASPSD